MKPRYCGNSFPKPDQTTKQNQIHSTTKLKPINNTIKPRKLTQSNPQNHTQSKPQNRTKHIHLSVSLSEI